MGGTLKPDYLDVEIEHDDDWRPPGESKAELARIAISTARRTLKEQEEAAAKKARGY